MLAFSPLISSQTQFLLESVNDSNYDSIYRELRQFVEYGSQARTILLQVCLDQVNCHSREIQNLQVKQDLIAAIFKYILDKPNFCTTFCEAVGSSMMREGFLADLSNILNLSAAEKIGVGLALSESETLDFRTKGQNFSIAQIEVLCANPTAISNKQIQDVVLFLYKSKGLSKHVDSFTKLLSLIPLKMNDIFVQSPVLSDDIHGVNSLWQMDLFIEFCENDFESVLAEIEKEMSMADIIMELGYECTVNISHCKEMLSLFLPLNEVTLSKLLGIIARTHVGLDGTQNIHSVLCSVLDCVSLCESPVSSSWNVDVLVDSIMQLAPTTNWISVMENLDHESFNIPDGTSFSLLMSIYTKACQDPFPLHVICGSVWKNAEGQLSFLRHAISAPPGVFTFVHCSRQLTHADLTGISQCDGNQAWSCLDLLNVLCQLAERGQINSVRLMLESPLNQCPEVLLVGIAQISTPYNLLQYEVSSIAFPAILRDPTKIGTVRLLWQVNPSMVLRVFFEISNTDPNNLFRVVEICQELKILSSTLDKAPSPVSIGLAVLAFGKERLENWLSECMRMYKVTFFEDCLKFLKGLFCDADPNVPDSSMRQSGVSVLNVNQETCSVFFKVLQFHAREPNLHQYLDELKRLLIFYDSKVQVPLSTNVPTFSGISDGLKMEANSYFCQMFSGQLTIDAMVERLACFKESSEKREQLLFDYMIANIFEEYNFFSNYADRQLIIAGVLFGSLVKHRLLNYFQLSTALRGVLDGLRKSVDSKMFIFGAKALEQFIDHLGEWPQYCKLILQISHLSGAHPELVSVVEHALALSSSSHAESNSECGLLSADQHLSSSSPISSRSMELAGSSASQFERQISSFERQHAHQDFLLDQVEPTVKFVNCSMSQPSHLQNVHLPSTPVDSITNLKVTTSQSLPALSFKKPATVPPAASSSSCLLLPSSGTTAADVVRKPLYGTGFGTALNIETLVAAAERKDSPVEVPASEVQDKILFTINNISTTNIDSKAKEFIEVLKEPYYPWFAQYMVMKRASIEPNFHDLYLMFLEKINSKSLNNEIVKATYENCKVLLKSELIKSSSEERSLLKNLGSWLGKFTIGRNKALLAKEIDPKVLIIEAYEKGLMIAVIPFTSKILEPCQSSLAYKPPNPWTMGILGLLAEIYNLRNLKLNLKFDIEVLFKNLGLDIKTIRQSCFLKDRVREVEGNPDFSNKDTGLSEARGTLEVNSSIPHASNHGELHSEHNASSHVSHNTTVKDEGTLTVPERVHSAQGFTQVTPSPSSCSLSQLLKSVSGWDQHMSIDSMFSLLQNSIIPAIMDMAIREITPHVTRHTIAVAIQTTKELIMKDYATETDVSVAMRAARQMVGNLAGNLAYVTSTGHLPVVLSNNIRSLLQTLNFNGEIMDLALQFLATNHICLGSERIKNIASEKAMEMIDEHIVSAFASIKKQWEVAGPAHFDTRTHAHGTLNHVSEVLRPKPAHMSIAQKQVYHDFIRNIWQSSYSNSSYVLPAGPPGPSISLSSTVQMNSNIVLASQVAPAEPTNLMLEEIDGSAQFSSSTAFLGPYDDDLQSVAGPMSVTSFPSSVTTDDLNMVEASRLAKDARDADHLSPMSSRVGSVVSESLLIAEDVVDNHKHLEQEVFSLFSMWCRSCDLPATRNTVYTQFISLLQQRGFFKSDHFTDWLFRFLLELSVAHCLAPEQGQTSDSLPIQSIQFQQLHFESIDAYAMLVVLILKDTLVDQESSKVLLEKVLKVIIGVIYKYAEKKKTFFNPRPYFRLFVNWFEDLVSSDTVLDDTKCHVLVSLANAFHELHPEKIPSFSFVWVDLVCHRGFMPKLLTIDHPNGWLLFNCLLVELFQFMGPFLRNAKLSEPILVLYEGTLRILIILLHDFPEFLCSFHFSFCDVIPHNRIQMRNLILSASPRNIKIPDPLTPNLKIDLLPEMSLPPRILSDVDGALNRKQLKADIDEYLETRPEGSTFLTVLHQTLLLESESSLLGTDYDVQLINSIVLYVGMQDIHQLQGNHAVQSSPTSQVMHSPIDIFRSGAAMNIYESLINNLDEEGCYFFLNAIANQLRFPNSHTNYFSFVLLHLFETSQENIQEQITRVLLERLIADRPYPWGLLTTFIELVKNPKYDFWKQAFIQRQPPDMKRLLEHVAGMHRVPKDVVPDAIE